MTYETDRLILRQYDPKDADDYHEILSDREACYWDGGYEPYPEKNDSFYAHMHYYKFQENRLVLELKESGKVIGDIVVFKDEKRMCKAIEIGYMMNKNYRRQGYMTEAALAVISHHFKNEGVELISAHVADGNIPSMMLLLSLGFKKEGITKLGTYYPGRGQIDLHNFYLVPESLVDREIQYKVGE